MSYSDPERILAVWNSEINTVNTGHSILIRSYCHLSARMLATGMTEANWRGAVPFFDRQNQPGIGWGRIGWTPIPLSVREQMLNVILNGLTQLNSRA